MAFVHDGLAGRAALQHPISNIRSHFERSQSCSSPQLDVAAFSSIHNRLRLCIALLRHWVDEKYGAASLVGASTCAPSEVAYLGRAANLFYWRMPSRYRAAAEGHRRGRPRRRGRALGTGVAINWCLCPPSHRRLGTVDRVGRILGRPPLSGHL